MSETPQPQAARTGVSGGRGRKAVHASCPACSASCSSEALFCSRCGATLCKAGNGIDGGPIPSGGDTAPAPSPASSPPSAFLEATPPHLPAAPPQPTAPEQPEARCDCGSSLSATAKFCPECGAKRTSQATALQLVQLDKSGATIATYPLGKETVVGKSEDCDIVLTDDKFASRRHARIYRDNGQIVVEDAKSVNGTFLRLSRPFILQPGDVIICGASEFRLESASTGVR